MKDFESYFSSDTIISYLCKIRVKVANARNKKHLIHLLTDVDKYNYHVNDFKRNTNIESDTNEFIKFQSKFLEELNQFLPSRKKWVALGKKSRINKYTNQALSSSDKNYQSLLITIKSFKEKSPNEQWLNALDRFVEDIQISVSSGTYKITPPLIFPKLKNEKQNKEYNECRPLCIFSLKDRIILSITNKYLTKLLDSHFEDCSYAFRSKRNKYNSAILTHHDCIKDVYEYRLKNQDKPLWVVECDMEKFYDSVNHKIVKELFDKLIEKTRISFPEKDFSKPSYIFYEFLDCYAFNKNVPSKTDLLYWRSYDIQNGEFGWIEKSLNELSYYNDINDERIGVPQGGALSGLIANIVLDIADKEVLKTSVFYTRFCDDMLIIHPDNNICQTAKNNYLNALKKLKLVPHKFKSANELFEKRTTVNKIKQEKSFAPFWKGKSKGPYRWGGIEDEAFPWIGFVGYEIRYDGNIRVRKRSFLKELQKQHKVVSQIKNAVRNGCRKSRGSITESAIHRLVGMSVGRITIKNYDEVSNDLCWKNGFKELNMNKYSIQQIKQLDRNRSRLYYDLLRDLTVEESKDKIFSKQRKIIHFNKPFSYYYQVLEREDK